jgi:alpha-L-fucosidase
MKKINLFNVSFCVLFCLISCQKNSEPKGTVASNSKSFDQTSNWVVLSKSDAVKKGRNYSWSFKTKHPVQYVVQIVFDKIPVQSKKVTLKMDSQKISSFIKQSYLTANKKAVLEFNYPIILFYLFDNHIFIVGFVLVFDKLNCKIVFSRVKLDIE